MAYPMIMVMKNLSTAVVRLSSWRQSILQTRRMGILFPKTSCFYRTNQRWCFNSIKNDNGHSLCNVSVSYDVTLMSLSYWINLLKHVFTGFRVGQLTKHYDFLVSFFNKKAKCEKTNNKCRNSFLINTCEDPFFSLLFFRFALNNL